MGYSVCVEWKLLELSPQTANLQKNKQYFTFFPDTVKSQVEWYKCKLLTFIVNFDKRIKIYQFRACKIDAN